MSSVLTRPARWALAAALSAGALAAQSDVAVEVPGGVPLEVVASSFGNSQFEPRGGALVIELEGTIRFRHTGPETVRAVTLAVEAHDQLLGGRAAVAVPSLHARTGEQFEVPVNLRMLRPLPAPPGPMVRIRTDAVLFDTLAAAGPDRLDSVRKMTVRELEARRDRSHFLSLWRAGGRDALTSAMQASLQRQSDRPRLSVRLAADGPATAGTDPRRVRFAFVQDPEAPLALAAGQAEVTGLVSDTPRIRIVNRSGRGVRSFEIGWLVTDSAGAVYSAGAAPVGAAPPLGPGESFETGGDRRFALRPESAGGGVSLEGMAAYVRSAQMDDGSVWIPGRESLQAPGLLGAVPVSDEERRLSRMYRERGPAAVAAELRKLAGEGGAEAAR